MRAPLLLTSLALAACASGSTDEDTDVADTDEQVSLEPFRAAFIADPHIIGDDYECCESPGRDTETIYQSRTRLAYAIEQMNAVDPPIEHLFVMGDVFHQNYKYDSVQAYLDNPSAARRAKELFDEVDADVHLLWGNHDYEPPRGLPEDAVYTREFSHQIFREIFETEPYYAIEIGGFKFLMTNTQLGRTWDGSDPMNEFLAPGRGSFGAEQLDWIAEQLDEGKPTFLMFHHPLTNVVFDEAPGARFDHIYDLTAAYADVIETIYVGHSHRWNDFSNENYEFIVMDSVRYDADNWWVHEFDPSDTTWRRLDEGKAQWGSQEGWAAEYDGDVITIATGDAFGDAAGDFSDWDPEPPGGWPPSD